MKKRILTKQKKNTGITLIALVVTIIVLLILAGVSIAMLTGENGILTQATKAKEEMSISQELENIQLYALAAYMNGNGIINARDLEKELGLEANTLANVGPWEYKGEKNTYKIFSNGSVLIKHKLTEAKLDKDKFQEFASKNLPTQIIFLGNGIENTTNKTDIGTIEGSIYAWIENEIMYVSSTKKDYYVQAPADCKRLFATTETDGWNKNLAYIDLTCLDTSNTTKMGETWYGGMFYGDSNLTQIKGIENLDVSKVTNMDFMFAGCSSLKVLDLDNWDTSSLTRCFWMFDSCYALEKLDVSKWNTSNVTEMEQMFSNCRSIESLDLGDWDTEKVEKMKFMFSCCFNLKDLNISSFNTSNVTDMQSMFSECRALEKIDVSSFDTSNVTNMMLMFGSEGVMQVKEIVFGEKWNTSKATSFWRMFKNCRYLTELDLSKFDTTNITDTREMFYYNSSLKKIYISSNWDMSGVTESTGMFHMASSLPNFNNSYIDKTYAYAGVDGYLTLK